MRRIGAIAWVLLLSAGSSACSGGDRSDDRPTRSASSSTTDAVSESAGSTTTAVPLEDRLGPPECVSGRVVLPTSDAEAEYIWTAVGATLPNGNVLVVVSGGLDSVVMYALTSACDIDRSFGDRGRAVLRFEHAHVQIWDAEVMRSGRVVLAGEAGEDVFSTSWFVARVNGQGELDSTFDDDGWTVAPWEGRAATVSETPGGELLVGGDHAEGGCCVRAFVGELTERGQVVDSYGTSGRTEVPLPFGNSGLDDLAVINDVTVAVVGGGNNGCWGTSVSALDDQGRPVPGFQPNFDRAFAERVDVPELGRRVFVSALVERDHGFDLIGTTQADCVNDVPHPTETGVIERFQLDGDPDTSYGDRGSVRFDARMADQLWAVRTGSGKTLLSVSPTLAEAGDESELDLFKVDADGATATAGPTAPRRLTVRTRADRR